MAEDTKKYIYTIDRDKTVTGFITLGEAHDKLQELLKKYPEPEWRVRNRLRSRTGMFDIVVKARKEVLDAE